MDRDYKLKDLEVTEKLSADELAEAVGGAAIFYEGETVLTPGEQVEAIVFFESPDGLPSRGSGSGSPTALGNGVGDMFGAALLDASNRAQAKKPPKSNKPAKPAKEAKIKSKKG